MGHDPYEDIEEKLKEAAGINPPKEAPKGQDQKPMADEPELVDPKVLD